jgi:hypothetical protein
MKLSDTYSLAPLVGIQGRLRIWLDGHFYEVGEDGDTLTERVPTEADKALRKAAIPDDFAQRLREHHPEFSSNREPSRYPAS